MDINKETLQKIAHLARLNLDEKDMDKMLQDINGMIHFVEKLKEVNTEGVEPLTTMSHEVNVLRDDVIRPHIDREQALRNAPARDDAYFRVPKVLE
jgi:aspartyl-tRNA(Asn)/glutamyl-tRNA(Gln) amidotransferase subunit C